MDPITQAAVGAGAAVALARGRTVRTALLVGAVAGATPDLDVLIRSETDPLLGLEYHRHFTHSLLFVPFVGCLVALLFLPLFRRRVSYRSLLLYATAGALTHGLIDACTSYGTMLYWPLIHHRESWDIISIIDPLFTLPLLFCLGLAFLLRNPRWGRLGLLLCLIYLGFGIVQRERAKTYLMELAGERGHQPTTLSVRPSFANLALWRMIYCDGDVYYVDAVNLIPFREPTFYPGGVLSSFTESDRRQLAGEASVLARDIERFRFFSQGFLAPVPGETFVLGDIRYAMLPNSTKPLWGIQLDPLYQDQHVQVAYFREASGDVFRALWKMICGATISNGGKSGEPRD